MMLVYIDNCCFNRPFDDQRQFRIYLETQAKLYIQQQIIDGHLKLAWSYVLDYENAFNPFDDRKNTIDKWRLIAELLILESGNIIENAKEMVTYGIKNKDALHIACAVEAECNYFLTTDDGILNKISSYKEVKIMNPVNFVK